MDTVTQIVLGGSIAAGFFTPKLGRASLFFKHLWLASRY